MNRTFGWMQYRAQVVKKNFQNINEKTPYFLTIETEVPIGGIQEGRVHVIGDDPLTGVISDGCCLRGVLWTKKTLDEAWNVIWHVAEASEPVRVTLAGKSAGRCWGNDNTKTAVFVSDHESGRGWKELD